MKKILLIMFLAILLVGTVSALDYDNIKEYDDKIGDYGKIEIRNSLFGINWFQLGKVAEIELKTNTEQCLPSGCEAVKEIIMYENGELIDKVRFIDKSTNKETKIINYKFEIKNKDGKWIEYNYKEVEGNSKGILYEVRLTGQVYPFQSVDWQVSSQGIWLEEYAVWTSALSVDLIAYYKMDEFTGLVSNDENKTNHLRLNNTIAWQGGLLNYGLGHNATTTNITSTYPLGANATKIDGFALSFWTYRDGKSESNYQTIISNINGGEATGNDCEFMFGTYTENATHILFGNNDVKNVASEVDFNVWSHYVLNYRGEGNLSVYRDSGWILNSSGSYSHCGLGNSSEGLLHLLKEKSGGYSASVGVIIDELGIWERGLTDAEIVDLYNGGAGFSYSTDATVINTLSLPTDATTQTNQTVNFSSSYVIYPASPNEDGTIFQNSTLEVWFSNGTLHKTLWNDTNLISNHTNFTIKDLAFADYIWNINVSLNNSADDFGVNRTLSIDRFVELLHTYNTTSFETSRQEFQVDIETIGGVQSVSAFLNYNATNYAADTTCSGSICNITATIDIPLVSDALSFENKTYFWQIVYFLGSSTETANTSTKQQNVTAINFEECGTFVPTTKRSVNFTTHSETTKAALNTNFNAYFESYLGTGTVKKGSNSSQTGASVYSFCIDQNETFFVNSRIDLSSTSYDDRHFDFFKQKYTNTTRIQRLLLLNSTGSSNIIVEVKNQGLVPLKDIIVNISRFYPGTRNYVTVEHQMTDEFGQIAAKLVENDVKYKFTFSNLENTVLKTSEIVSIICRSVFCIVPFVIEDEDNFFERMENISSYTYVLSFDNSTNMFSYSWNDQRGEATSTRLEVTRYQLNASSLICNTTSTSTLSSLSCSVGASRASYKAQVFRSSDGETIRIDVLNIKVGDPSSTYGLEGLLWVFILLFTCIGIGAFNPTVGAALYGAGFIIMGVLGVISMPLPVFFANTLIIAIFIWAVNKR